MEFPLILEHQHTIIEGHRGSGKSTTFVEDGLKQAVLCQIGTETTISSDPVKPQSLGSGLTDSPSGASAEIAERGLAQPHHLIADHTVVLPDGTHTHKAALLVPLLQLTAPLGPLVQLYRLP